MNWKQAGKLLIGSGSQAAGMGGGVPPGVGGVAGVGGAAAGGGLLGGGFLGTLMGRLFGIDPEKQARKELADKRKHELSIAKALGGNSDFYQQLSGRKYLDKQTDPAKAGRIAGKWNESKGWDLEGYG